MSPSWLGLSSVIAILIGTEAAAYTPKWPRFSWDKVPVFYHSCNFTGPYTDKGIEIMAKFVSNDSDCGCSFAGCNLTTPARVTSCIVGCLFTQPFVTIEKGQGVTLGSSPGNYAEDKIVDTLRRVKAIDPNISTIFYYNS